MNNIFTYKHSTMHGVAAGGLASLRIPAGGAITVIRMVLKDAAGVRLTPAEILADIEHIQLTIGGKNKVPQLPPDVFLTMEKYLYDSVTGGSTNTDGVLEIDLLPSDNEFPTFAERYQYAWGTKGLDSIMLYAKIAAAASKVAMIEVYTERNPADVERTLGQHIVWRAMKSLERATAGEALIDDLPKATGLDIRLLMIREGDTGVIASTNLEYDKTVYRQELQRDDNEKAQKKAGRTPQAKWWVEDFSLLNASGSTFPTQGITELFYTPNWSTAPTTYDVYVQVIEGKNPVARV